MKQQHAEQQKQQQQTNVRVKKLDLFRPFSSEIIDEEDDTSSLPFSLKLQNPTNTVLHSPFLHKPIFFYCITHTMLCYHLL
jgi:hypothetical protein